MIKSFVWTLIFWSLFILFNTVSDAILFYSVFPLYGDMWWWHFLKYFWIGFAVLTGVFALRLWTKVKYEIKIGQYDVLEHFKRKKYRLKSTLFFGFLLLWFLLLRWRLHESLMYLWRQ